MVLISNSEVDSFQKCQRAHWYAYGLKLSPKEKNLPLKHGILGHAVLEEYYKAKRAELPHDECIQAGLKVIANASTDDSEVLAMVTKRFLEYAIHYKNEPFRVIDVEGAYSIPLGNGIIYGLTLDLLVEMTVGQYKGEQAVIDTKWCYNFWTTEEVHMHPQIPKYIASLRRLGSTARVGYINMIRYRPIKEGYTPDQIFQRVPVEPTQARLDKIMAIQKKLSNRILIRKQLPQDLWHEEAEETLSRSNCKNCFFVNPCSIELDGRDPGPTLRAMFKPNSYGYTEEKTRRNLE